MLILFGVSFRTAPVAVRKALTFSPAEIGQLLERARTDLPGTEALVLSTCNRTEFYLSADSAGPWHELLKRVRPTAPATPEDCSFYERRGLDAFRHLAKRGNVRMTFCNRPATGRSAWPANTAVRPGHGASWRPCSSPSTPRRWRPRPPNRSSTRWRCPASRPGGGRAGVALSSSPTPGSRRRWSRRRGWAGCAPSRSTRCARVRTRHWPPAAAAAPRDGHPVAGRRGQRSLIVPFGAKEGFPHLLGEFSRCGVLPRLAHAGRQRETTER